MRFKPFFTNLPSNKFIKHKNSSFYQTQTPLFSMAQTVTQSPNLSNTIASEEDANLFANPTKNLGLKSEKDEILEVGSPRLGPNPSGESRIEKAWAHWKKLGEPKLIVAPMVDNSELPFRLLCRKYGATAAYTPMLHSRIFTESEKYRLEEFTTCKVLILFSFTLNCMLKLLI